MSHADKPFLQTLKGNRQAVPPIWLMRQAGRYLPEYRKVRAEVGGFLDLCFDPDRACEVTLQPIRRYGFDAAILFSDILVIPLGVGQKVWFVEGEGPKLEPLNGPEDLAGLTPETAVERLAPVMETVAKLSASLPRETALIGFAGAPWTVATYMIEGGSSRDFARTKLWAYRNPDSFRTLMEILVEATAAYLIAQVKAGAEAIQIFDSWAGALATGGFEDWVIAPNRALVEKVRAAVPHVPIIGFPRGAGVLYREFQDRTGVDVVSIDQGLPVTWARDNLQPHGTVQGNLDPFALLAGGDVLDREVDRILDDLSGGPFVFNLGHGIIKETPPDHVTRLVERVRRSTS